VSDFIRDLCGSSEEDCAYILRSRRARYKPVSKAPTKEMGRRGTKEKKKKKPKIKVTQPVQCDPYTIRPQAYLSCLKVEAVG
jgi:hypothetical protein